MDVCIPNVEKSVPKGKIFEVFQSNKIGLISNIRFVFKKHNKLAFITFNKIYENELGARFKDIINKNEVAYIVYDDYWFWKCSKTYY